MSDTSVSKASPSAEHPEPHDVHSDRRYRLVLLSLVMASMMAFGSLMTIVTVALGQIAEDLGSTRAVLTWAITGLMLAMAVATPLAGKLGDTHGHRKVFLIGLAGLAASTLACGLAWDATSLIVFRVVFGFAGALVNPNALALMMHAYGPERRTTAVGWFQFAMTGAPTIGLVVGGPLIDQIGWRWLFVGFAAITLAALVASLLLLRPTPRDPVENIDYAGGAALGIGVLGGLLLITRLTTLTQAEGLSALITDVTVWLLLITTIAAFALFVRIERRVPAPMLRLDYFARRNFTLPMVSSSFVQFAYMGGFVVTPALLGDQYGWTLSAIALLLVPRPASFSLASPLGGYLPSRIGQRRPIILGAIAMIVSMAAFIGASYRTDMVGIGLIVVGLVLSGLSAGISQPSVAAMVVDNVDARDMGVANGMSQQLMFIGIVTGVQLMNILVGDEATQDRFATAFAIGCGVAGAGLLAAYAIREPGKPSASP